MRQAEEYLKRTFKSLCVVVLLLTSAQASAQRAPKLERGELPAGAEPRGVGQAGESRAGNAGRPRAAPILPVSARQILRMHNPHELVLGEEFQVALSLPLVPAEQIGRARYALHWTRAFDNLSFAQKQAQDTNAIQASGHVTGVDGMRPRTAGMPATPASQTVSVLAPHEIPGRAELRLYRSGTRADENSKSGSLIDVLTINVVVGTVAGGVVLQKSAYSPDEEIIATIRLPPNRYYNGHFGPYIGIVPVELDGKPVSEAQLADWNRHRNNVSVSLDALISRPGRNRHDGGALIAPGTYVIDAAVAREGKVRGTLKAPDTSGRFEVRLYDRQCYACSAGSARDFATHGYYFALAEFVVGLPGSSPTDLRFVRHGDAAGVAIKEIAHGEVFVIEARYKPPSGTGAPQERTASLEWADRGEQRSQTVILRKVRDDLYRSGPIVLSKPAGS